MPRLLTIGYGNRGFEAVIQRLRSLEVTHVVDVRRIPESSYWTDFRRRNLEMSLPEHGFRYVYMGDTLGAPEDPGCPEAAAALDRGVRALVNAAQDPSRQLCLMCGCLRAEKCHRSALLGPAILATGLELLHVNEHDQLIPHANLPADPEKLQGDLFNLLA